MKKKYLIPTLAIGTIASMTPLMAACSQNQTLEEMIYDSSLEYFVGKNFNGGICSIPHGSYNLEPLRQFLIKNIKDCGIKDVYRDLYGNLWYDIPASQDSSITVPLALQAHMDMVWTTEDPSLTHPIPVKVTENGEELIRTKDMKSSLGADNGAGLGIMLALTKNKDKFSHGPIRCIITADEEPGMVGASKAGILDGGFVNVVDPAQNFNYLLNLDAEVEGQIYVSCAGGYSADYSCYGFNTESIPSGFSVYELDITGMLGGHSGMIMDQNPVNGPKLCAAFANKLDSNTFRYIDISTFEVVGNVVPDETKLIFASSVTKATLDGYASEMKADIKSQHSWAENFDMQIKTVTNETYDKVLNSIDTNALTTLLTTLKFGNEPGRETLGQKASANLCPFELHLNDKQKQLDFMVFDRSEDQTFLIDTYITGTNSAFTTATTAFQTTPHIDIKSNYPAYQYKENDQIRTFVKSIYEELLIPTTEEHTMGGIECAFWAKNNPNINQTSIGPTIDHAHEVIETLHLNSFKKIITIVLKLLDKMADVN